jgi:hypothetical protein
VVVAMPLAAAYYPAMTRRAVKKITVYCDDALYAWVSQWALQDGRTMSQWVARKLESAKKRSEVAQGAVPQSAPPGVAAP